MVKVLISEIFTSLQGEAKHTGKVTTFVRLGGCPFKCVYCDQKESRKGGTQMDIDEVMMEVHKRKNKFVCITGGEPMMQYDELLPLIYELNQFNYTVTIETSGMVALPIDNYKRSHSFVMDVKCPCSGMEHKNFYENLSRLHTQDEVKFVIRNKVDIDFARDILKKYPTKASIIYSPVDNDAEASKLIQRALIKKEIKGRIGLQIHKILRIK